MINVNSKRVKAAIAEIECDYGVIFSRYYAPRNRVEFNLSRTEHGCAKGPWGALVFARYLDAERADIRHDLANIFRIDVAVQIRVIK
jgi:hypothetical protein